MNVSSHRSAGTSTKIAETLGHETGLKASIESHGLFFDLWKGPYFIEAEVVGEFTVAMA